MIYISLHLLGGVHGTCQVQTLLFPDALGHNIVRLSTYFVAN